MKKKLLILICLLFTSFAVECVELKTERFTFQFTGNWKVATNDNGSTSAMLDDKDKKRMFILSVYRPAAQDEAVKFLIDIQDYITNLDKVNSDLKVEVPYSEYQSKGGAPFMYVTYADKKHNGFFIGASLGSSAGVLLITFEGNGNYQDAISEFKTIADSMKIEN